MLKRLLKIVSIVVLFSSLIGCETATIIDLYHAKTEKLKMTDDVLKDSAYEPYIVGGIFFKPYMTHESETGYPGYSLRLNAYRKIENSNPVILNHIKIIGKKDVVFKEINQELTIPLDFSDDENYPSFQSSKNRLIEETNNYNMELTEGSVITVVISVTVDVNGESVTKDLTYDFTTRFRTYAVTR
ncbi:hypothetical protein DZB84_19595 [Bacillus sp. HNG]|uniref:hypothetical protein n=1 Tax=Bacillus sp. HNG TaxID=2293325 RepID=UPI000E2ECF70|nr:hypothetical protein [Bacillus sp. HNG]RFB12160.1 hypothetical protein DZB84_19595 [Bacillus sp. HNG]